MITNLAEQVYKLGSGPAVYTFDAFSLGEVCDDAIWTYSISQPNLPSPHRSPSQLTVLPDSSHLRQQT